MMNKLYNKMKRINKIEYQEKIRIINQTHKEILLLTNREKVD